MRKVILGCFLFSQSLFASVFCDMNSVAAISCEFSLEHHNRILIEGGRIKKIIFPEDQLAICLEETSGQAFVQAKHNYRDKVLMSVISLEGIVQDIEVVFKQVPSQVVVLRIPSSSEYPLDSGELVECNYFHPCSPQTIVAQILKREVPLGFRSVLTMQSAWRIRKGLEATLIGCLEGCEENLYLYQVRNTHFWKKCILETDFKCAYPSWVYVKDKKLSCGETTLAIVAVPL